jgi:hypothetical protein
MIAYVGGFLPSQYLRRTDRLVLHVDSRNQDSRWREIIESITLSLSDQQLVTGLAILIAGYYETLNNGLSVYHWNIVVYLAWMSSAVHIASLTLLKDVFNKRPKLRNIRVAGMLLLLVLLTAAMWPLRRAFVPIGTPVRCLWRSRPWNARLQSMDDEFASLDINWVFSVTLLIGAYVWKLSQLFSSSRGWVRQWLIAKPQAATERIMRRALLSHRAKWLTRPAYFLSIYFYAISVVYTETADSFAAAIVYLCLALARGAICILYDRSYVPEDVKAGESALTFGQLVPLFLLILPALTIFELSASECTILLIPCAY